jgi:hypothetical protein
MYEMMYAINSVYIGTSVHHVPSYNNNNFYT